MWVLAIQKTFGLFFQLFCSLMLTSIVCVCTECETDISLIIYYVYIQVVFNMFTMFVPRKVCLCCVVVLTKTLAFSCWWMQLHISCHLQNNASNTRYFQSSKETWLLKHLKLYMINKEDQLFSSEYILENCPRYAFISSTQIH